MYWKILETYLASVLGILSECIMQPWNIKVILWVSWGSEKTRKYIVSFLYCTDIYLISQSSEEFREPSLVNIEIILKKYIIFNFCTTHLIISTRNRCSHFLAFLVHVVHISYYIRVLQIFLDCALHSLSS